jgi:hypothetical protein
MTEIVYTQSTSTVTVATPTSAIVDVQAGQDTVVVNPPDFAYISVHDTTDQADGSSTTVYKIRANNIDQQYLINFQGDTFTFLQKGLYSIIFSVQWQNASSNFVSTNVFLKKNNQVVPNTSSYTSVPAKHGQTNGAIVTAVNFLERYDVNDTLSLWWQTNSAQCTINAVPATTSPVMPLSPSVIITIVQVA